MRHQKAKTDTETAGSNPVSKFSPYGAEQPCLGVGPLTLDRAFRHIKTLRHFPVGQATEKFHDNDTRLFRVLSLKTLQSLVDQQHLFVGRRVGEFQFRNIETLLPAAVLQTRLAPRPLNPK